MSRGGPGNRRIPQMAANNYNVKSEKRWERKRRIGTTKTAPIPNDNCKSFG